MGMVTPLTTSPRTERHSEQGTALFVTLAGRPDHVATVRCRFSGCRERRLDGSVHTFTGPPPRCWGMPLLEPEASAGTDAAEKAVREVARPLAGHIQLKYCAIVGSRVALGPDGELAVRPHWVWALVGRIACGRGRAVPVGWSGTGDGLDRMGDRSLCARLRWLVESVSAAEPTAGYEGPAVLAPQPAAVFAHETIGHFAETAAAPDIDLHHRIGVRVAADLISAVDDPGVPGGSTRYDLDDDGVQVLGPTRVLEAGVLVRQLYSLDSARRSGTLPTANGRAASAWSPVIPRMSNLVCSAGGVPEEALAEALWSGLWVHQVSHGHSHGMMVEARIVLAEWVEAGQLTGRFVTGGRIAERVGVLTRVVELGDRISFNPNGMCGKAGQVLFDVGSAAPAMRLDRIRVSP